MYGLPGFASAQWVTNCRDGDGVQCTSRYSGKQAAHTASPVSWLLVSLKDYWGWGKRKKNKVINHVSFSAKVKILQKSVSK